MAGHTLFEIKPEDKSINLNPSREEIRSLALSVVADYQTVFRSFDIHDTDVWIVGYCEKEDFKLIESQLVKYPEFSTFGIDFYLELKDGTDANKIKINLETKIRDITFKAFLKDTDKFSCIRHMPENVDRYFQKGQEKPFIEVPIGTLLPNINYSLECCVKDPEEFEKFFKCTLGINTRYSLNGFNVNYHFITDPCIPPHLTENIEKISLV